MFPYIIVSVCSGITAYYVYKIIFDKQKTSKPHEPLECLKNALLAHALVKIRYNDMNNSMNYASFDGTKLPMLSGCSVANACFSYIISKQEFRKGPFYSQIMESKIDAIEKYLNKNLDTDEKVVSFFDDYVEKVQNTTQ
jgi:LytS/YehU family sensor histidine kinase